MEITPSDLRKIVEDTRKAATTLTSLANKIENLKYKEIVSKIRNKKSGKDEFGRKEILKLALEGKRFRWVGDLLGISTERVCQIVKEASAEILGPEKVEFLSAKSILEEHREEIKQGLRKQGKKKLIT